MTTLMESIGEVDGSSRAHVRLTNEVASPPAL